jgi:hypothetical protein
MTSMPSIVLMILGRLNVSDEELDSSTLLELGALASDELLSETLELELSLLLSELDSIPEPLSHGQPDSVTLSPLHPAQKKAVVVSKRFFQCLRMFIIVAKR